MYLIHKKGLTLLAVKLRRQMESQNVKDTVRQIFTEYLNAKRRIENVFKKTKIDKL